MTVEQFPVSPLSAGSTNGRFPHVPLFRLPPIGGRPACARWAQPWRRAGPAAAGAPDQTWNCRASAAYVAIPARDRAEPVVANGSSKTATESPDRARCADDAGSPADTASDLGLKGPAAETTVNPDRGLAVDQSVTAKSSVADFAPGERGLNLVVHSAHSAATATCTPAGPSLSGSSQVPLVSLNGQVIDITPVEQTVEPLPTGQLVKIRFNEQTRSGNTLTQRAVHLEVQDPAGRVVKDVVVAEARVAGGSEVWTARPRRPPRP